VRRVDHELPHARTGDSLGDLTRQGHPRRPSHGPLPLDSALVQPSRKVCLRPPTYYDAHVTGTGRALTRPVQRRNPRSPKQTSSYLSWSAWFGDGEQSTRRLASKYHPTAVRIVEEACRAFRR
jgi:hypothetical protein